MSSAAVTKDLVEVAFGGTPRAVVTQYVIEGAIPVVSRSPTTPTGAGVTKYVAEVAIAGSPAARITQYVVEAAVLDSSTIGDPGTGTVQTTSYGFAT